jgi:hypothetical protein
LVRRGGIGGGLGKGSGGDQQHGCQARDKAHTKKSFQTGAADRSGACGDIMAMPRKNGRYYPLLHMTREQLDAAQEERVLLF